ncbi:MAG: hypothetical protein WC509_04880 [Candidatus Izemoplasmatales bacterium]
MKRLSAPLTFIAIQTALAVAFLWFTEGVWTRLFQYLSVLSALSYPLLRRGVDVDRLLAVFGLFLTAVADFLLVAVGPFRIPALACFLVSQSCHAARLDRLASLSTRTTLPARIALGIALTAVPLALSMPVDALSLLTPFYASFLLFNAVVAFRARRRDPFAFTGIVFLILCDFFILLSVGTSEGYFVLEPGSILAILGESSFNFAWLFYAASLALLALGAVHARKESTLHV